MVVTMVQMNAQDHDGVQGGNPCTVTIIKSEIHIAGFPCTPNKILGAESGYTCFGQMTLDIHAL